MKVYSAEPTATAIATLEEWNRMGRFINPNESIITAPASVDEKETTPIVETKSTSVEIKQLSGDKESVSRAYKAMESNEKEAFEQPYNKFQSYLKSHDEAKYEEAIQPLSPFFSFRCRFLHRLFLLS
jgi:hypothetical protein